MNAKRRSTSWCERAAVGSSRIRQRASSESARAISTTWRSADRAARRRARRGRARTPISSRIPRARGLHGLRQWTMPLRDGQLPERDVLGDGQSRGRPGAPGRSCGCRAARAADRGRACGVLSPAISISPASGLVVAGEDLHERRLAGAVLAEQCEDGAAGGVEVDSVEDLDAAERLADPACVRVERDPPRAPRTCS